jgi:transcriptional regulator with XRE-family HTH domain
MRTWKNPNMEWHSDIPFTLRMERQRQGVQQGELARRIGVAQSRLSGWELGQIVPSIQFLLRWVEALDFELKLTGPKTPSSWQLQETSDDAT